jgi:hypothetical protein
LSEAEFGKNVANLSNEFAATPNRRFKFNKGSQLFVGTHNEALSIVRCASAIQIVRPLESIAKTQRQLRLITFALFQFPFDPRIGNHPQKCDKHIEAAGNPRAYEREWNGDEVKHRRKFSFPITTNGRSDERVETLLIKEAFYFALSLNRAICLRVPRRIPNQTP